MNSVQSSFTLANDVKIPCLGYGTWKIKGPGTTESVLKAIELGYRHIDTAMIYDNEVEVGKAIRECKLEREELFVTSKLWNTNKTFEQSLDAFHETMGRLELQYLDLYLLHWPSVAALDDNWQQINQEKWRALENLYLDGKIKAIGVSNFRANHLEPLIEKCRVVPMVNQLEIHPGFAQAETRAYCNERNILAQAWSPLACGAVLTVPQLVEMAERYSKSVAQICLRWCLQNEVLPITKTTTESRMVENMDIFDFTLSARDMEIINGLAPCGGGCVDPDVRKF